jgi:hypothetical protein
MSERFIPLTVQAKRGPEGRSTLYKRARSTPGLFIKAGRKTLVDTQVYEQILAALPHFKPTSAKEGTK